MYTRENFDKIKDMIDARREEARRLAEARTLELHALSEDIENIDRELRGTGLLIFKTACNGGDIEAVRSRNRELNQKRREIIKSLGYPEDYADVKYHCTECNDTGYVDVKMCKCFRSLLLMENIKSSGMGKLIEKQSFENFDLDCIEDEEARKQMERNIRRAKDFADNFNQHRGENILMIGKTGSGKTHISTAIAKVVIEKGYDVLYETAQNIVCAFETDTFKHPAESVSQKYLECDLLILDDLGTEFSTQFTVSCIYNLINTRANKGLSTIISTNLSGTELSQKYDDRIYSRLVGGNTRMMMFNNKDYRLARK